MNPRRAAALLLKMSVFLAAGLFRDLLGTLSGEPGGSKYARCVRAWGLDSR